MNESIVRLLTELSQHNLFVKGLVIFGSEILPYILVALVGLWVLRVRDRKKSIRQATMIIFAALLAVAVADLLKYWFNAPRPFMVLEGVQGLVERDPFGSFPSAHMTFFTALAVAAFRRSTMLSGMLWAGALIVGVSRVAAGVHFPVDVIAGLFLGASIALTIGILEKMYFRTYSFKRRLMFWK
jgi:undecaprenyl-diphosphatase